MASKVTANVGGDCASIISSMPNMTEGTLDKITSALEVEMKYAPTGADPTRMLQTAASSVTDKMRQSIANKKYQGYLNLVAKEKNLNYVKDSWAHNPYKGLKARLVGVASNIPGSRLSAANQQSELLDTYLSGLVGDLTQSDLLKKVIHKGEDFQRNIVTELERIGQPHVLADTLDPDAKKAAEIMHKWQEKARLDANDAGASIGSLPGFIVKQTHDIFRVRKMGQEAWKDSIRDRLDWERIEKGAGEIIADTEEYLDNLYRGISSGVHMKHVDAPPSRTITGSQAGSLSHERVLHFKPGEWFNYNKDAGSMNLMEAAVFGLEKSAHTTGLMRTWGPSAEHNILETINVMKTKYPEVFKGSREANALRDVSVLTGSNRIPGSNMMATVGQWIRVGQNVTKLGGAAITAGITDPFLMSSELRFQGASRLKGYGVSIASDFKAVSGKERMVTAQAMGIMFQGMIGHMQGRIDAEGLNPGLANKVNNLFFKASLLTPHTDRLRMGAAQAMGSMAAGWADGPLSKAAPEFQRVMGLFDIDEADWSLMRHGVEELEGTRLMTMEGIDKIPDDVIRAASPEKMSDRQVRIRREELRTKYHSYLIDRVDTAVLKPDAGTASMQTLGTQAGTLPGEIVRSMMQFKGFPIAFIQKVLGRDFYGSGASNLKEAMKDGNILANFGLTMLQTTILGYGVMVAKDLASGKEPRSLDDEGVWREAVLKGGGMGFYGDILFGELKKEWGRGGTSALLGPGISTADDVLELFGKWREGDPAAVKTMKTVYKNLVPNTFYTKPVMDFAILYPLMEMVEKGSVKKSEKNFKRLQKRNYLVPPTQFIGN